MHLGQSAVALADGAAHGVDDERFVHAAPASGPPSPVRPGCIARTSDLRLAVMRAG
jgi:hypothetical protein